MFVATSRASSTGIAPRADSIREGFSRHELATPAPGVLAGFYAVNGSVRQLMPKLLPVPPPGLHNGAAHARAAAVWEPLWTAIRKDCASLGWVAGSFELYECEARAATTPSQ